MTTANGISSFRGAFRFGCVVPPTGGILTTHGKVAKKGNGHSCHQPSFDFDDTNPLVETTPCVKGYITLSRLSRSQRQRRYPHPKPEKPRRRPKLALLALPADINRIENMFLADELATHNFDG